VITRQARDYAESYRLPQEGSKYRLCPFHKSLAFLSLIIVQLVYVLLFLVIILVTPGSMSSWSGVMGSTGFVPAVPLGIATVRRCLARSRLPIPILRMRWPMRVRMRMLVRMIISLSGPHVRLDVVAMRPLDCSSLSRLRVSRHSRCAELVHLGVSLQVALHREATTTRRLLAHVRPFARV